MPEAHNLALTEYGLHNLLWPKFPVGQTPGLFPCMIAVSNTTPLRYLAAIEQEHLLEQLFKIVFVPTAVHEELTEARAPENVRLRVVSLPSRYEVRAVQESQENVFPVGLHRGERDAILLAELLRPDVILIDEQIGRTIASGCKLPVSGTLESWNALI